MPGWPTIRTLAVLIAWLGLATAGAVVSVVSEPTVSVAADQYATLTFPLAGEGTYRFEVVPPEGWVTVTRGGEVTIDGAGFVSVTLRVPALAPAGEFFRTELRLYDGEVLATTAAGVVAVVRRTKVTLQGPDELTGTVGAPLPFEIVVANEGNAPDAVMLSARHSHWDIGFDSATIALDPGERRVVGVTIRPTSTVNSGYRHIFHLVAASADDPAHEAVVQVTSRFYAGGQAPVAGAHDRPQITLKVSASAAAGLKAAAGSVATSASYSVRPALEGQLSDYVDGSLRTNPLAGSLGDPFEEVPSSVALSLQGPGWDGSLSASRQRYALDAGVDLERWRLTAGGSVAPGTSLGATARLDHRDLDLQLWGRTGLQGESRTDAVAVHYGLDLTPDVELTLGTEVSGFAGHTDASGYQVALAVSQRLAWSNDAFDVGQSYAGVPFAGIHTVGLSGGTLELDPWGVRALTSYSVSPVSSRWNTAVTLYGRPLPGLSFDLTGSTTVGDWGGRSAVTWTVSPRVSYTVRLSDALTANVTARYGHGGVASGSGTTWDRYEGGVRLAYRAFRYTGSGQYEVRQANDDGALDVSLKLAMRADLALGADALLFATYDYDERASSVVRVRHDVGLGWDRAWSPTLVSRIGYLRTFDPVDSADRESVSVALGFGDVVVPGLRLNVGYSLSSPTSVLDFGAPLSHDLRIGMGYDIPIAFDTPPALVELFGGRRGGEVRGVAFLDADLNGVFDEGERPLAGLSIQLGTDTVTTDDQGHYRLRLPEGAYAFAFPSGLPATVDLRGDRELRVVENQVHERSLAFAPVVSLTVELFDDRDQDGAWAAGEAGIPYGGVVFDGAERRVVRTDGSGRAIVAGLVAGRYVVSVSSDHLPAGYRATSEATAVVLNAGDRPDVVRLGAARPPRSVIQTYTGGSLAVLPRALQASVARGGEAEIEALVQGGVERVVLVGADGETSFAFDGSRWRVVVRVPREAPAGPLVLTVRAEAGDQSVERPVHLNVVDRPPFVASSIIAAVNEVVAVAIETHFQAESAVLHMPTGETLTLMTADGYRWTATWQAPAEGGRFRAGVVIDGEELGEVAVSVFAPPVSGAGASVAPPNVEPAAVPPVGPSGSKGSDDHRS